MLQALSEVKTGKACGPSEVSLELTVASRGVGIHVMSEICLRILDGFEFPVEWALSILVPIFKGKGDIRKCSCYVAVKFRQYGMKVVERVLEKMLCKLVSVDEIQFGFMPERGTFDAVSVLRRMQEMCHAEKKVVYVLLT